MSDALLVAGFLGAVLLVVVVALWLKKARCPACRKLFAGRVTASTEIASVKTTDWGYDDQRQEHRHIPTRHTGHLIKRLCRHCGHEWERMESSSQQLGRLSDAEAKEYRKRKLF